MWKTIKRLKHFQKEFGYEDQAVDAKRSYEKSTRLNYLRGLSSAGVFGSVCNQIISHFSCIGDDEL